MQDADIVWRGRRDHRPNKIVERQIKNIVSNLFFAICQRTGTGNVLAAASVMDTWLVEYRFRMDWLITIA